MGEVLSGCAVRAAIQMQGDKFMKVQGVELENCRVCGNPPKVSKLADDGLHIGCERDEPEYHRAVVESTPGKWAIDTWNMLQGGS